MKSLPFLPLPTLLAPLVAWIVFAAAKFGLGGWFFVVVAGALIWAVLTSVHHAEVVAHRVGEPMGTVILAFSVTVIEVGLIVSVMFSGGPQSSGLARDTVFAAVMIILTGMVGLSLLVGGLRFKELEFDQRGVSTALVTMAAIIVLTLILPNYTLTTPGPTYTTSQLVFISITTLILYVTFLFVQTVRHRDYFLVPTAEGAAHAEKPTDATAWIAGGLLLACLGAVVLLAKTLAPVLESAVERSHAPHAVVGVVIAMVVLLPESLAAFRAARANRIQDSLNLSLGSALASIGLTIPAVAAVSIFTGVPLALGLDVKSTVLLMLSFLVTVLSLATGRTTIMQGVVHLVIFAVYLFITVVP